MCGRKIRTVPLPWLSLGFPWATPSIEWKSVPMLHAISTTRPYTVNTRSRRWLRATAENGDNSITERVHTSIPSIRSIRSPDSVYEGREARRGEQARLKLYFTKKEG